MRRPRFVAVVMAVIPCAGVAAVDDPDPIKGRLDKARAAYEADLGKARDGLLTLVRQKEEAAQKAGDLAQLKKTRADREAFTERGELPKVVSTADYSAALTRARSRLEAAYVQARKEYTQNGKIKEAEAIEAELERFKGDKDKPPAAAKVAEAPDRRQLWIQANGYFVHGAGKDWFEKYDDGKQYPNLFTETQRTKEFIELRHQHMPGVNCRLYPDKAMFKTNGDADWKQVYVGKWQAPTK